MAPPHPVRTSEVQALLDIVREGSGYNEFDPSGAQGNPEHAVTGLLRQVQSQFGELERGRDALAMALRELENQLSKLNAEAASLRTERDHLARLKGLYERKFASIRELAQQ